MDTNIRQNSKIAGHGTSIIYIKLAVLLTSVLRADLYTSVLSN